MPSGLRRAGPRRVARCSGRVVRVSAGATIAMDSGTENLDWVAASCAASSSSPRPVARSMCGERDQRRWPVVLERRGHHAHAHPGHPGHDSGQLDVLTGKQALEFSAGLPPRTTSASAGTSASWARTARPVLAADVGDACRILHAHYDHTYRAPGERFPRPVVTTDPVDRDVSDSPHDVAELDFTRVGDIFSEATNPGRRKPFDIRAVMAAVVDQDDVSLERWSGMQGAETAVVLDARLGGHAVCVLASSPVRCAATGSSGRRPGPVDGGTLFPLSSKKVARPSTRRAAAARCGPRQPLRLRRLAGIAPPAPARIRGRDRPGGGELRRPDRVLCHLPLPRRGVRGVLQGAQRVDGGAALEGSHASVIGGAPAAAVVFVGEVDARTKADDRSGRSRPG